MTKTATEVAALVARYPERLNRLFLGRDSQFHPPLHRDSPDNNSGKRPQQ